MGTAALFATTAELCPSQKTPTAVLWAVTDGAEPRSIASWRKDLFASRKLTTLFQAGIVQFPSTEGEIDALPFTGTGLTGLNGRMFVLRAAE